MSKIDCSKTLNFIKEAQRMCDVYESDTGVCGDNCPLLEVGCYAVEISQMHIDIVQKWSDEHPQETMAEHFFKMFPKAKLCLGMPDMCPEHLGWAEDLCENGKRTCLCEECWNRPYGEVTK